MTQEAHHWGREHRLGLAHPDFQVARVPPRIAFVDRDGVLNEHRSGYRTVADFRMIPGAARGVRRLNDAGIPVVLVTNQRGLATGRLTLDELDAVHALMLDELAVEGAWLDDIRICPHDDGECTCRKPLPGMLEAVLAAHPETPSSDTVFFGDADSDAEAARRAGVPFERVSTDRPLEAAAAKVLEGIRYTDVTDIW